MKILRNLLKTLLFTVLSSATAIATPPNDLVAPASSKSSNNSSSSPEEIRLLLNQLDKMTDENMQSTAEQLSHRLLAELEHRPDLERTRGRRSSLQKLRTTLTDDLTETEKLLEEQRQRLTNQLKDIESQTKSESQARQRRTSLAINASAPSIRASIARRQQLTKQIAELDSRIDRCVTNEQILVDSLSLALANRTSSKPRLSLPIETPLGNIAALTTKLDVPNDKPLSDSNTKLLEELGIALK